MPSVRAATDIGGTFTDLVYFDIDDVSGEITDVKTIKAHTTPGAFEKGVLETIKKADLSAQDLAFFAHGSTVVINALTERKGVKTALITTKGFRDILEIGRGNRPDFFNLRYQKPAPFVPRYLRREIPERMNHKGEVLHPLDLAGLDSILSDFKSEGVEAIAICLLHAYANPAHEKSLKEAIEARQSGMTVVASHQISREWREYERANTAALCAYVKPIANAYLDKMEQTLGADGFAGSFYVMQSNGGIDTVDAAKETPITIVESGPASGVLGAAALGELLGIENIIAFDIGGTTAKCSLIDQGRVSLTNHYMIEKDDRSAGYPIMTPVVDIVEIGNGGGSIGWVDDFGKMHVGPRSAGALPGPVAYGKGGKEPTTTDANLMLGRINPHYFIGGELEADMVAVENAFQELGQRLGMTSQEAARGVVRIANHNMSNALKLVSINRGYDPRDFTMVAFGGGGAMHAASLARDLNIPKVIIPGQASVFSAWGMLMSDLRRDYARTLPVSLSNDSTSLIQDAFQAIQTEARDAYIAEGITSDRIYCILMMELRYEGQEHSVPLEIKPDILASGSFDRLATEFHEAYERKYTYRLDNAIEVVSVKVTAFARVERPKIKTLDPSDFGTLQQAIKEERNIDFDEDGVHEATIYQREKLGPGTRFKGPAIVEEAGSTLVILPGQSVMVDDYGNVHITIKEDGDE